MPFEMKVQPIDVEAFDDSSVLKNDAVSKPANRSRLKRLFVFDRQFTNVLRSASTQDKVAGCVVAGEFQHGGAAVAEFEPSSMALDKMVRNFMEDNEKTPVMTSAARYGRNRCNCFNRSSNENSDDELDFDFGTPEFFDTLKSLIPCSSKEERNLLAETSKIVEKNKGCKRKEDLVKIVIKSLFDLNYDAALCKSKWEKSYSIPAGEYEYIDVKIDDERIIIDVDFRSEFEIARSTGSYKAILQLLPIIFVGKSGRLSQIIAIVAESIKLSLKKRGMHVAPWRKSEYIRLKWLGNFERICPPNDVGGEGNNCNDVVEETEEVVVESGGDDNGCVYEGELDLIFGYQTTSFVVNDDAIAPKEEVFGDKTTTFGGKNDVIAPSGEVSGGGEKLDFSVEVLWQPPAVKLNNNKAIVTGLASLLKEKF